MKKTGTSKVFLAILYFLWLLVDDVSGDWGENCGIGNCLDGYHCCSVSTGTCCPGGFFCSGAKCVSLVIVIFPCIVAAAMIGVTIVVVITCKKLKSKGIEMHWKPKTCKKTAEKTKVIVINP
ncbi:uncharacterized protein LOC111137172 [Crassostrea virginica]